MIVLLTDGRANVSLAKSNEEPDACAEGAPRPSQARDQGFSQTSAHWHLFRVCEGMYGACAEATLRPSQAPELAF